MQKKGGEIERERERERERGEDKSMIEEGGIKRERGLLGGVISSRKQGRYGEKCCCVGPAVSVVGTFRFARRERGLPRVTSFTSP